MQQKKIALSFLLVGIALMIATSIFLTTAGPVSAQCGSQASSCKNCHEVQAQKSVNSDGTGWHQSHAFGDFCYICHGGNQQAADKAGAHQGLVNPLADVKASCQQCHVADLDARAKVYADKLGVQVGSAAPAATSGGDSASAAAPVAAAPAVTTSSTCNEMVANDPNAVDYAANYDAIVLGKQPVNWGNSILLGLIGLMVIGGGGYVINREKFVNIKFGDTKAVDNEYPTDVVDMLPKIANLKSSARKSLNDMLESKKAEKVLDLIDEVVKKDEE